VKRRDWYLRIGAQVGSLRWNTFIQIPENGKERLRKLGEGNRRKKRTPTIKRWKGVGRKLER
jgi:hypothetical protein